jgi:hypothetical protein
VEDLGELIGRLQERARDADVRVDRMDEAAAASEPDLDAATFVVQLARSESARQRAREAGGDRRSADLVDRATELAFLMAAPAEVGLAWPANRDRLDEVQTVLGVALPKVLRRALGEVADGGFGPGHGLLSTADLIRITGRCRRQGEPSGSWPADRLPVADLGDGVLACVDLGDPAAPVVLVDPQQPDALAPAAPSLAAWLAEWASASSPAQPTR